MAENGGDRTAKRAPMRTRPSASHRAELRGAFAATLTPEVFTRLIQKLIDLAERNSDKEAIRMLLDHGLGRPSAAGSEEEMTGLPAGSSGDSARKIARAGGAKVVRFPGQYAEGEVSG